MSLKVAKAFIGAIRNNEQLIRLLGAKGTPLSGARLFSVYYPEVDKGTDKLPYIVIMPQGINTTGSKDEYEQGDAATVDVLIAGNDNFDQFVDIAQMVRDTIEEGLEGDNDFTIDDYTFSAGPVQFDPDKPCYFQTLTYIVNTQNTEQS